MRNRSNHALPAVLANQKPMFAAGPEQKTEVGVLSIYDVTYLHFHRDIEIGYCVSGEGICYVEEEEYPFKAGDVQVIFPYQRHLSKNTTGIPSTWYWASIDPIAVLKEAGFSGMEQISGWIVKEMGICGIVDKTRYPQLCEKIKVLIGDIFQPKAEMLHRKEAFAVDLLALLIELCNVSIPLPKLAISQGDHLTELAPALDYIRDSLEKEVMPTVSGMSEACHMSPANFRRVFHKTLGVSPKAHIDACVMHKAKRLLACSGKSICEIAGAVGYLNISGFNRSFLEFTGMTPSTFRKTVREENG